MNQMNTVMLAILVALGMAGSSLTTILPSVYAQTSSGQAGSSSPPISGASPPSSSSPSQQGSENACPTGFTLSHGQCTAPVSYECRVFGESPLMFQGVLSGTTCREDIFATDVHVNAVSVLQSECAKLPGQFAITEIQGQYNFDASCTYPATPICPGGITPTGEQCVTRPGQGNQP
jgi:hypothetical protein